MKITNLINYEKKTRKCSHEKGCGKWLPWDNFSLNKQRGIPISICKKCRAKLYNPEKARKYYLEKKDEIKKKNLDRYYSMKK